MRPIDKAQPEHDQRDDAGKADESVSRKTSYFIMACILITGVNIGFHVRGKMDKVKIASYTEVYEACQSFLDDEKVIQEEKKDYQDFMDRKSSPPRIQT